MNDGQTAGQAPAAAIVALLALTYQHASFSMHQGHEEKVEAKRCFSFHPTRVFRPYHCRITWAERPPLGRFESRSVPPCASTTASAMARPRPLPPVSRLRDSSIR
jgi:hypothetical protein